ncbi:MAG: hypothetical protein COV99_01850 [Bacteroidetes bacterium CG12_big_fil_rev_8_21_14_0_65_60_17]|nr:MAG: hypothetical protein COV99_01850 [Bacteroidetes bacterium CG12_big_fil_rev_8_21_14_0_65_60_17]
MASIMTESYRNHLPGRGLGAIVLLAALLVTSCSGDRSDERTGGGIGLEDNRTGSPARTETINGTSVAYLSQDLPSFSAQGIRGESIDERLLEGRISLVNFWATWCGPCIIETPELVGLYEEWSDRPFQILGVSMDTYADQEVVDFVDNFEVTYPVFVDTMGVADAFGGAFALPTTYLVDGTGTVVRRYIGLFPVSRVRAELDSLITALES